MKQDPEQLEKQLVWEFFGSSNQGFFIEVGANDPTAFSQTCLLERHGWSGILVEPNPGYCEALRQMRPRSTVVQAAAGAPEQVGSALLHIPEVPGHAFIGAGVESTAGPILRTQQVAVATLNDILDQAANPKVDFLSIDVEGMEGDVLRGLDLRRHRPGLILIEDHLPTLRVHAYLGEHGYRLIKRTGLNNWYVPYESNVQAAFLDRVRLFRKIWLSHPFRKIRLILRQMKRRQRPRSRQL